MATINFATREITAKLVYYGASKAGSNTNLRQLHRLVPSPGRSRLHKFGPGDTDERTYYFEFVAPQEQRVNGFDLKLRVYSLPGALALDAHRLEVIKDVDALVLVADARPDQEAANMDHLLALEELLGKTGLELASLPMVIQVNHLDDPSARSVTDVVYDLNPYGFPVIPAVAIEPRGVLETHTEVAGALVARIRDNMAGSTAAITLTALHRAERETDEDVIRGHIEAIQQVTTATPASSLGDDGPTPSTPRPRVELPFQPPEFTGTQPVQLLSANIEGTAIEIELLMQSTTGGDPRPLRIVLANRPTETPVARRVASQVPASPDLPDVGDFIPDSYDLPEEEGPDLPGWVYGLIGVAGGLAIGVLGTSLIGMSLF